MGGIANPNAGDAYLAGARAAEQINASVQDIGQYMQNLRGSEESSKADLMFLEMKKADAEVRQRLDADPEFAKLPTAEQQSRYEVERDVEVDRIRQATSLSHKEVVRKVDVAQARFKTESSLDYQYNVVTKRVVAQSKIADAKSNQMVTDTVVAEPTIDNIKAAADNIATRYSDPKAYATYGAQGVEVELQKAIGNLKEAVTVAFSDKLDNLAEKFPAGAISTDDMTKGVISLQIADSKLQYANMIEQLPISQAEKAATLAKADKFIEAKYKQAVTTHNKAFKEAETERMAQAEGVVTVMGDTLVALAGKGQATEANISKAVTNTFRSLGIDPMAVENGTLTDPTQIKLAHKVQARALQAQAAQDREMRERRTEARAVETLRLQREMAIMPTTQKGADLSFKDFQKQNGLAGKPFMSYSAEDMNKVNTWLQQTSPLHLPKEIEGAISWGIKSNNPQAGMAAIIAFKNLEKSAPTLAASMDTFTREVAQRVLDGEKLEQARENVTRAMSQTPEQRAATSQIVANTVAKWDKGSAHPVAKHAGADTLTPSVLAFANRTYKDSIAKGESPKVAEKSMIAAVEKTFGKTDMMSGDGSSQLTANSPEKRFNVGDQKGPGWFASMFGARPNEKVVTSQVLKDDVKETLKGYGFPEDQKHYLGQPRETSKGPMYPVLLVDKNGVEQGPAMDKNGNVIFWTFDPENNSTMRKQRAEAEAWDKAAANKKRNDAINLEYTNLVEEQRRLAGGSPVKMQKIDHAALRRQAEAKYKE